MKKDEYRLMTDALQVGIAPCPARAITVVFDTTFITPGRIIYLPLPEAVRLMRMMARTIRWQAGIGKAVPDTFVNRWMPALVARYVISTLPMLASDLSLIQRAVEAEIYRLTSPRHAHAKDPEIFRLMIRFCSVVRRTRVLVSRLVQEQESWHSAKEATSERD